MGAIEQELILRDRAELAQDFKQFVKEAWPIVEPGVPYLHGYHIDAIAEHLQACAKREIKKLVINIPPRHTKSTLCSVLYPVWLWTHAPNETMLFASYAERLAIRDAVKARYVVESDWFQARWPLRLLADTNLKSSYQNERMGKRETTSVGGTVTGLGGRHLILDDPHNVKDAESAAVRERAVTWWRESWHSRANTKDTVMITIMQRVHSADISHHCVEQGWEALILPMQFDGRKSTTCLGWTDPRREVGETLWPTRYAVEDAEELRRDMGEYAWAGQYQQIPTPRGGGLFKSVWLRFWYDEDLGIPAPVEFQNDDGDWIKCVQKPLPPVFPETKTQSWDLAFKGTDKSDFVVGQVWAPGTADQPAARYLLDQERGRFDFPATLVAFDRLAQRHPTFTKWVEEKANGSAVISTLSQKIPGIIPVNPQGGKESRAAAVASLFESGCVYLPHPDQFPWVRGLIEEITTFPRGANDDQVDAMTQALIKMQQRRVDVVDMGDALGGSAEGFGEYSLERDSPFAGL